MGQVPSPEQSEDESERERRYTLALGSFPVSCDSIVGPCGMR